MSIQVKDDPTIKVMQDVIFVLELHFVLKTLHIQIINKSLSM